MQRQIASPRRSLRIQLNKEHESELCRTRYAELDDSSENSYESDSDIISGEDWEPHTQDCDFLGPRETTSSNSGENQDEIDDKEQTENQRTPLVEEDPRRGGSASTSVTTALYEGFQPEREKQVRDYMHALNIIRTENEAAARMQSDMNREIQQRLIFAEKLSLIDTESAKEIMDAQHEHDRAVQDAATKLNSRTKNIAALAMNKKDVYGNLMSRCDTRIAESDALMDQSHKRGECEEEETGA